MSKNALTIAEVNAFAQRVKAALENAETDRRTVEALRALVKGDKQRTNGTARRGREFDDRILAFVRGQKTGAQVGDLIRQTGMNRKALTRVLARLRRDGSIKMTGAKRLARYFAL